MSYLKLRTKHKKWDDDLFFGTEEPNFYRQLNASSKIEGKYTFDGSALVLNWGSSSISLRLNGERFVSQNMIIYAYDDVSKLVNTSKDAKKESQPSNVQDLKKKLETEPVKEPTKVPEPEPVKQATKGSKKKKNEPMAAEPMSPYMNFSEL